MDKLIAAAKARGIKAEDIQTSGINLSPQYDYNNRTDGQPPRFLGYQVSNSVRATTGKIDDIGPLLDALVAAGGTNIDGPWFGMKDADAQLVGARGAAIKSAEAKAQDRSEEHTSELQSLMRISYAVFCLKKKKTHINKQSGNRYNQQKKVLPTEP